MPKVLYVLHNHPAIRPGGVETYTLELFAGIAATGRFQPLLLARRGDAGAAPAIAEIDRHPGQYFFWTGDRGYDPLTGAAYDKRLVTEHYRTFLETHHPDVVHFQHTLFLGYDLIRQTRNTLPRAPILYTLHEFLPICHNHGQLIRTTDDGLCRTVSPAACHDCFPDVAAAAFFRRTRFIQSHLALVDRFLAPSRCLLERYVDWGLPRDKIHFEDYGRRRPPSGPVPADVERPRNRFGFFGQLSPYKGVDVLLRAMQLLDPGVARLTIHGANLEWQAKTFQHEFAVLLDRTGDAVEFVGRYDAGDVPRLMAAVDWVVVPSIWWENSPLVIQEAFQHRRPVICSDIGGMAEKVDDEVNGLHFRTADPRALSAVLHRAATTPGLWARLREGIRPVPAIADHAERLADMYATLIAAGAGPQGSNAATV